VPVVLAVLGTAAVLWSGTAALNVTGGQVTALYTRTARPMADLAKVRDATGDARSSARDLAVSTPGSAQKDLLAQIRDTDQAVNDALDAYVSDRGGTLDAARGALLTQARAALAGWRQIRDTQVAPAAAAGNTTAALAAVAGALAQADATFSDPMDKLFDQETSAAAVEAVAARRAVSSSEQKMIIIGVLVAVLALLVGLVIARLITGPVARMVGLLGHVAEGT
jgi:methyl-accepting chemotaxis protein